MSSLDSVSPLTKEFLNKLNVLLREYNHHVQFTDGTLSSLENGYIGALEDSKNQILLVDEYSGDILYESENLN